MKSHQKYSHLQENEDADVYLLTRKSIQDRVQRWGARQEVLCEAFYEIEYAHDFHEGGSKPWSWKAGLGVTGFILLLICMTDYAHHMQ